MPVRLAALGLALVVLAGCANLRKTLGEVYDLADEGGRTELRDPMRPLQPPPRVLLIGIDGLGEERLRELLADGTLPNLAALFGADSANAAADVWRQAYPTPGVTAVFPSETAAGWAAIFTGAPPAENGIPGNEWFSRDSLTFFAPVAESVTSYEQTITIYTDSFLNRTVQAPTLFERADRRAHVALAFVYRGADLVSLPNPADVDDILLSMAQIAFMGKDQTELFEEMAEDAYVGVREGFEDFGVPDLQAVYFPGPDLAAHAYGGAAQAEYLHDEVDRRIGQILELYRERDALRDLYVVLTADHGHTPRPKTAARAMDHEDDIRPIFDEMGVRLRGVRVGADSVGTYQAVAAFNGSTAFVYLADRSSCPGEDDPCDWAAPAREEDVLPVAQALYDASALAPDSARTVAWSLVLARVQTDEAPAAFQAFDGERLVPLADYLRRESRLDLHRLEERLAWLTDGPHGRLAGDIILIGTSTEGYALDERYYFGEPLRSGHGSAGPLDSLVPLVLAREGASGAAMRDRLRAAVGTEPTQLDVTDLVLHLLQGDR